MKEKTKKIKSSRFVPAKKKVRVDSELVHRGLVQSRTKARALIMSGKVFSGEKRILKAGDLIDKLYPLDIRGPEYPWVGRGGVKLDHGLSYFGLSPESRTCIDVGASTGGFTHVLLENGASRVYAIDVGYGQLADKLRNDPRIITMERTNARYINNQIVSDPIGAIVCDASFIGLKTILPASLSLASSGCWLVALIKPQFEVGPSLVGRGGIVRDKKARDDACANIKNWIESLKGWKVLGLTESPITGNNGNIEFLIAAEFNSI